MTNLMKTFDTQYQQLAGEIRKHINLLANYSSQPMTILITRSYALEDTMKETVHARIGNPENL